MMIVVAYNNGSKVEKADYASLKPEELQALKLELARHLHEIDQALQKTPSKISFKKGSLMDRIRKLDPKED